MEEGETLELVPAYAVMFTPAVLVHNLFTAVLWFKNGHQLVSYRHNTLELVMLVCLDS